MAATLTTLSHALANAFLAEGAWTLEALVSRGQRSLDARPRWLTACVRHVLARFEAPPRDRPDALADFIAALPGVARAASDPLRPVRVVRWAFAVQAMGAMRWPVPELATLGALAAWIGADPETLEAYLDPEASYARPYRLTLTRKPDGRVRVLEAPREALKGLQRRLLAGVLDHVPPHACAAGFRAGASVRGCAAAHAGHAVVLHMDLAGFFTSVTAARVRAIFRAMGYPEGVAWGLACLCTTRCTRTAWRSLPRADDRAHRSLLAQWPMYRERHLPQGAPTSPMLANLAAYGLDVRLDAAAQALGARYSRYADDLVFSGDEGFARRVDRFAVLVGAVALDEGFSVRWQKTRVMRRGAQQRVLGLVVNARARVPRAAYDALRATLYNCVRRGPAAENREAHADFKAHLAGRIGWVAGDDPRRRAVLDALFARIVW